MLELTAFQIFFMILSACMVFFALAFLARGRESRPHAQVVSYREFQRQKERQLKRQAQAASVVESTFRDVYEVASGDPLPAARTRVVNQPQLLPASEPDTITHFPLELTARFRVHK